MRILHFYYRNLNRCRISSMMIHTTLTSSCLLELKVYASFKKNNFCSSLQCKHVFIICRHLSTPYGSWIPQSAPQVLICHQALKRKAAQGWPQCFVWQTTKPGLIPYSLRKGLQLYITLVCVVLCMRSSERKCHRCAKKHCFHVTSLQ